MPEISLTSFVDFVIKSGVPRLTLVRDTKKKHDEPYNKARDYYRKIRDKIIEIHKNKDNIVKLNNLMDDVLDKNKQENYPLLISNYIKFIGRKKINWFDPSRDKWGYNDLLVKINPELGLEINGKKHIIKLYFKKEILSKNKIDIINNLMFMSLGPKLTNDTTISILDILNCKLHSLKKFDESLIPLLEGEIISFCEMWKRV